MKRIVLCGSILALWGVLLHSPLWAPEIGIGTVAEVVDVGTSTTEDAYVTPQRERMDRMLRIIGPAFGFLRQMSEMQEQQASSQLVVQPVVGQVVQQPAVQLAPIAERWEAFSPFLGLVTQALDEDSEGNTGNAYYFFEQLPGLMGGEGVVGTSGSAIPGEFR